MAVISEESIKLFKEDLFYNEKTKATIDKYSLAVQRFALFLSGGEISKQKLLEYRQELLGKYKAQTVNGNLSAINAYLDFIGQKDDKVKLLKVQHRPFMDENKELTKEEYKRLLIEAKKQKKDKLYLLLMTLCSTGIRISELKYITVEAVYKGRVEIYMKGKYRTILIPEKLCRKLKDFIKKEKIQSGLIFCTKNHCPLDRSNICHDMKKLCEGAAVNPEKVFPHNFRHLFARLFYSIEKNIAHLADVLGHSRIETTRIYVAVSAAAHEKILNAMELVI